MKSRTHDEAMVEYFRARPTYAAELLAEVCRDDDAAEVAILLRQMAKAFGQGDRWSLADAERKLLPI